MRSMKFFQSILMILALSGCVYAGDNEEFQKAKQAYQADNFIYAWNKFKPLAESGHRESQYYLGLLYSASGTGRAQNLPRAAEWYSRAAQQGHVLSQFSTGMMYQYGTGLTVDYSEAFYWLEMAAKNDLGEAQLAVSRLLANKKNPNFDPVRSYMWFLLARFSIRDKTMTKHFYDTEILGFHLRKDQEDKALTLALETK